jgi:excinuclease ABC subunit A
MFSFNSPYGACPTCDGLGTKLDVDTDLIIPDPSLSISEGAVQAWSDPVTTRSNRWKRSWAGYYEEILEDVCRRNKIPTRTPWKDLSRNQQKLILHGGGQYKVHWGKNDQDFEGVIPQLERRYRESESEFVKEEVFNRFMRRKLCPTCKGARLKPESLAVSVGGKSIAQLCALSVSRASDFFNDLTLSDKDRVIAKQILKEIQSRLSFLVNVGLDYVTLDRESATLAGGEAQRIHLATQIGSGLVGVMYVLDEPTIGLHQRDNDRLLKTLLRLRDLGNTLIVVEHDEDTIRAADWVVDIGPGAGVHGGTIVAEGPPSVIEANPKSLTGQYLRGDRMVPVPKERRLPHPPSGHPLPYRERTHLYRQKSGLLPLGRRWSPQATG